jgi:hypothetical protein
VRHGGNGSVLINNHEVSGSEPFPVPRVPGYVYAIRGPFRKQRR